MTQSIELNIADLANDWLKLYKLDYRLEQESLNVEIDKALDDYFSNIGGRGRIFHFLKSGAELLALS